MSTAAWVCDSCETNNLAQARVCRVCQRPPGSVTGAVRSVPDPVLPVQQASDRPRFVESKHTGQHRPAPPAPPAEPPRIALTPAPARAPGPPRRPTPSWEPPRRNRRAMIWLAVAGIAIAIMLVLAIVTNMPQVFGAATPNEPPAGSPVAAQAPRSTPCPAVVATWLPDGGSGAVLVAGYTTEKHVVTICRDGSGQLFYDGLVRGAEASSQTHISLRATATASGFVANNKSYVYEINGSQLIVSNGGREVYRAALTRTGP